MFSLLRVASLILPSVFGGCCYPDQMSYLTINAGQKTPEKQLVDFKEGKYIIEKQEGDEQFLLSDMKTGKTYRIYRDGSCSVGPIIFYINQCMSRNAKLEFSVNLAGSEVDVYKFPI